VLAINLDRAPLAVQIQALELLRTHRIFTRSSVHTTPKQFIFVPVLEADSGGQARVASHLNDFLAISHWHDPEDGFVNLEDGDEQDMDEEDEVDEECSDAETEIRDSFSKKGKVEQGPQEPLVSEAVWLTHSLAW
jgi:hypothetical protein